MANEFIIKNGYKSRGNAEITGSINISSTASAGYFVGNGSGITGNVASALTASYVLQAVSASYAPVSLPAGILSGSAQIATEISGAFTAPSASFSTRVTSNTTNIGTLTAATASYLTSLPSGILSGSAQIATEISGAFTAPSASFSTRVTANEVVTAKTLVSSSAQIATEISGAFAAPSASFSTRVTTNETNISTLTSVTSSYATTASNQFNGNQNITGSLYVTGSNGNIDSNAGILYDSSGISSLKYTQRGLYASNNTVSVAYNTRRLYRNDGTTISFDWEAGELNDNSGTLAIDLGTRTLTDRFGTEIGRFTTTGTAYLSGSLIGTASWAENATSASFASTASFLTGTATSASYAISASHLIGGGSAPAITINANGTTLTEVTSDSDLPTTLAANTTYLIRGNVATGKTLNVTNVGSSVIGIGRNQSHLSYTGSNELFNVQDQSFSVKSLTMKSSGSIMTARNVTPGASYNNGRTKVLDIKDCQVKNTNNVMDIAGFELVDLNNVLFWYITGSQGLSFQSIRHLEISSCEFYNWYDEIDTGSFAPTGTRMLDIRPNTGSVNTPVVNINSSVFHPEQGQVGLYIDPSSETLFGTVASNTFIDVNGGTLLAGSTYDSASMLNYDIGINQGLADSKAYLYGYQVGTDTQSATTSYTQITIANFTTDIETRMSASTAGITYIGTKPIDVMFQINAGVADVGGNNEQFDFVLYKNASIINGSARRIELDAGEEGNAVTFALTNIVQDDLLTVYQKSPTNDGFTLQNFAIIIKE